METQNSHPPKGDPSSVKEKTPLSPDAVRSSGEPLAAGADGRKSEGGSVSPRIAGITLVFVGITLMSLSGWMPTPSAIPAAIPAWENVSTERISVEGGSSEGLSVVSGGAGDDDIYGEDGGDAIAGGEGDDFIEAKDGARDHISCGPGDDVASVDAPEDIAAADCETVYGG